MYSWPAPPVRHLAACQPVGMIHRVLISLWPVAPYVPHTQWLSQPACSWNVLWQVVGRLWICLPQLRVSPPAVALDSYILTRRDPSIGQCPQIGGGGGARREQMTHRYREATRGNRRLKAHWDERSLSPLITKAVRRHCRHRRDADQLESQTWSQTSPQSWLAACVMRPTKKKKKDCPRLKEEVLTGSLRHRFWSRLPLGRNYDLWLFNVVISRGNHKNKWLKIEHF